LTRNGETAPQGNDKRREIELLWSTAFWNCTAH